MKLLKTYTEEMQIVDIRLKIFSSETMSKVFSPQMCVPLEHLKALCPKIDATSMVLN